MTLRIDGIPFALALIIFFGMHMWPVLLILLVWALLRNLLNPFRPQPPQPPPGPSTPPHATVYQKYKVDRLLQHMRKL